MSSPWDLVAASAERASCAVVFAPYMKADTMETLLERLPLLARLVCVTRWQTLDVASGASDVVVRDLVVGKGGTFGLHPTLHAKYYRFDDEVLVGSANLTGPGLGLSSNANLEILTRVSDVFDALAFEQRVLAESRAVSDAEYEMWLRVPAAPRAVGRAPEEDLLSSWRPVTRNPRDVWRVYAGNELTLVAGLTRANAAVDLASIMAPSGLDEAGFNAWAATALLASSYVAEVRAISLNDEPGAFLNVGESWNLEPGAARYAAETIRNWVSYFGVSG